MNNFNPMIIKLNYFHILDNCLHFNILSIIIFDIYCKQLIKNLINICHCKIHIIIYFFIKYYEKNIDCNFQYQANSINY